MNKINLRKGYSDNNIVFNDNVEMNFKKSCELYVGIAEAVENIIITVEKDVKVKLYVSYELAFNKLNYQISLLDNANLEIAFLQKFVKTNSNFNIELNTNAKVDFYALDISELSNNNLVVNLNGEYATFNLNTASICKKTADNGFKIRVNHNYQATESYCTSRAVVLGASNYFNRTEGFIENGMSFSKCHQDTKAIVFDEESSAHCDPVLLIDEYDVEASHAAAVGQISKDDLYYLQSRGLNYEQCIALLVNGFVIGVIEGISSASFKEMLVDEIHSKLTV